MNGTYDVFFWPTGDQTLDWRAITHPGSSSVPIDTCQVFDAEGLALEQIQRHALVDVIRGRTCRALGKSTL